MEYKKKLFLDIAVLWDLTINHFKHRALLGKGIAMRIMAVSLVAFMMLANIALAGPPAEEDFVGKLEGEMEDCWGGTFCQKFSLKLSVKMVGDKLDVRLVRGPGDVVGKRAFTFFENTPVNVPVRCTAKVIASGGKTWLNVTPPGDRAFEICKEGAGYYGRLAGGREGTVTIKLTRK